LTSGDRTQRITAIDIEHGRIRVPIRHKSALPATRDSVRVAIKGRPPVQVAWDPRLGPDRERSGVLYMGASLRSVVAPNEVLSISVADGVITLD
jgi:hypothetical protein